jgi:hypothetical protein
VDIPEAWLGSLWAALGQQLPGLCPQDCAYLLWALAQLPEEQQRREQQEALLGAVLARSAASLRQYDPWQLAHAAWSLGKMGARLWRVGGGGGALAGLWRGSGGAGQLWCRPKRQLCGACACTRRPSSGSTRRG